MVSVTRGLLGFVEVRGRHGQHGQAENFHLVRNAAARFFSTMLFSRAILSMTLTVGVVPALAQKVDPFAQTPNHLRLYTDCMRLARSEPLKALPMAEKWKAEG